jgi:ferredoxin
MRIDVDSDRCEGHGLCAAQAPEVFELDDDALVHLRVAGDIPAELRDSAARAAGVCPVAALRPVW